jgi:hypothetical protein
MSENAPVETSATGTGIIAAVMKRVPELLFVSTGY